MSNTFNRNEMRSAVLPIYIVRKDAQHHLIGRRKINFQINAGRVYHINYHLFAPKGYHLASHIQSNVDCWFGNGKLNVNSVTFVYIKNQPSSPQPSAKPIVVNYIDINGRRNLKQGKISGHLGERVQVTKRIPVPNGYVVCGGQKTLLQFNHVIQHTNLLVEKQPNLSHSHQRLNRNNSVQSGSRPVHQVSHPDHSPAKEPRQDVQQGRHFIHEMNEYNWHLSNQLIDQIIEHNLHRLVKVVRILFKKFGYSNVSGVNIHDDGHEVSGLASRGHHGDDRIYIRALKLNRNHQISDRDVRDFYTSMVDHYAYRGTLITTATFNSQAIQEAKRHSITLINGLKLARLMLQNEIGVKVQHVYRFNSLDVNFFND